MKLWRISVSRRLSCALTLLSGLLIAALAPCIAHAQSAEVVRVALPNDRNLQWMNFWVAQGAGYFRDEGVSVSVVAGAAGDDEGGRGAVQALLDGEAELAVLPRPMFLIAASQGQPVLAFANLLRNDPINLVVRREVADAREIAPELPLADRLRELRGLRIGVAPGPVSRLRVLLAAAGLEADSEVEIVTVPGNLQNEAFADGRIDALYAHTPFLEHALSSQDAVLIVNQSAGEIPALAGRQIHLLVTTREIRATNPDVLERVTGAIARAQRLIHSDREATLAAIRASGIRLDAPDALDTLVAIYEPAVPFTPDVSIEGALRELDLFPSRRAPPDLTGMDMADFVDNSYAQGVPAPP